MSITAQQLSSFLVLAIVMSVTPGPNNLMVLFSSVRFGARKTLGHISGASAGSALMLLLVGLGLHEIFTLFPYIQVVMKYSGAAYILYLSWKILGSTGEVKSADTSHPMSFIGAAFFQLINPKSWIMASVAISTCLPSVFSFGDIALYTVLFAAVSFPCVGIWAWFGAMIKHYLTDARLVRRFNQSCAGILALSALSMTLF
ncbi:lysine transporter LysE [Pectobacterium odoriferum]|uniref:Lysine transporter LysE n=1 Tax=Pectobacterium odoriferum TaxID=78398 RepID=A0ABD6VN90_9GAMM|nr:MULTISPECIES: LysE family translocator [Enterobacterales]POE12094.1 lysine transporter LysE [Pectobacterium odoriferum]POE25979.1 lysine transporter LysE [Pectobacterium odoriferum]POE30520.1 lysine transporter LysE [Pectobacterium odoriferum]QJT75454.1 LysE family translocator [Citrobacter freundii]